jgi:hypothetical protein
MSLFWKGKITMKNLVCNFVFVLSVTTSCASKDALNGFCPSECYTGRKSTNGVGLCKSGVPKCDEGFNVVECVGEVVPFPYDSCDGFDNDCDGKTDEDAFSMSAARFDYTAVEGLNDHPCDSLLGACSASTVSCTGGKYVCNLPTSVELPNEVSCDSVDNDCDGVVDENLFSGEFCYTAPADQWWTSMNPPCHPGRVVCYNGVKQCVNEFLPSPEVCDNADNNCNGIIDDIPLEDAAKYDIVFIFDTSGSMCDEIQAVAGASSMYAQQFDQNENFKFAVVILNNQNLPYVVVY